MNFKSKLLLLVSLAVVAVFINSSHPQPVSAGLPEPGGWSISDLGWIAGDWQTSPGGRAVSEEHWTRPAGGSMIGMSRTLAGDKTVAFEFLRLEQRGDAVFYVASPNGRCPSTDFKLTKLSGQEAVFENPAHDFPKRITYRKNSDGGLVATVDAGEGTKSQVFTFKPVVK
ncbi:MAG TPA: DUF6265 family protein [Pyrinomonadaceae bacterium]|nr:DUF6265 family protein [Pyrinomonadaceae bacterium]